MSTVNNKTTIIPIQKTLMLENTKELVLFHKAGPEGSFFHSFEEVPNSHYLNKTVRLNLHQNAIESLTEDFNTNVLSDSSIYTVSLDKFLETTIIVTHLENGTDSENVMIIENNIKKSDLSLFNFLETDSPFIRAPKGESCFGRAEDRSYFLMVDFSPAEAKKIADAMLLVSESLCSKLAKFEAALPEGAGGRVWNIRKSQNREPLTIVARSLGDGVCGQARVESGRETHPIGISLNPKLVQNASIMGIAVVIIHEIAHQFGVLHDGWMNTSDYEGALWASHNVADVKRSDIESYVKSANLEIGNC